MPPTPELQKTGCTSLLFTGYRSTGQTDRQTDRQRDGYRAVTSTFTTNYVASINSIDTVGPTHTSVVRLLRPNLQLQVALDFHLGTTRR